MYPDPDPTEGLAGRRNAKNANAVMIVIMSN